MKGFEPEILKRSKHQSPGRSIYTSGPLTLTTVKLKAIYQLNFQNHPLIYIHGVDEFSIPWTIYASGPTPILNADVTKSGLQYHVLRFRQVITRLASQYIYMEYRYVFF